MINREDMLELTRRMTPARNCFSRIAGAYMDEEGYDHSTFNLHFRKRSVAEQKRNLDMAKTIPISRTNEQLKEYAFPEGEARRNGMWPLLSAIKKDGMKDDALLSVFMRSWVRATGRISSIVFSCFMVPMTCRSRLRTMSGWKARRRYMISLSVR